MGQESGCGSSGNVRYWHGLETYLHRPSNRPSENSDDQPNSFCVVNGAFCYLGPVDNVCCSCSYDGAYGLSAASQCHPDKPLLVVGQGFRQVGWTTIEAGHELSGEIIGRWPFGGGQQR